ncbi:DUF5777 family beta-barrel protein [Aquiflexum sp. TKW24L]|uniref:DUF5777 family beta-barrel protein n=1 Tax=Aquiflexum sp. TKW24L TaxID=2942212 RepID=UPI0020C13FC4|nr:DUF5777 family beta-barrel protein [Aquiflexum sp. TKW24L]MCL6258858.1 DUF5777 family beta-barrel protein [Aquiflexum sp. TKW24L]
MNLRYLFLLAGFVFTFPVFGQLERKLASEKQDVDLIFHAPRHINLLTVEPLDKKALHFAIMHTFGTLDGGIQELWGLDNGANIQFSFEYALSDKFSLGAARQGLDKVYNIYGRYHLLKQTQDNQMPFSLSLMGGAAVNTSNYEFLQNDAPDFIERTSYAFQVMAARKFNEKLSVQISPMLAYFVDPNPIFFIEGDQNLYLALGFSGKYKVTGKSSLTLQWIPNLNNDLRNNVGFGIDLEAGGHVFQMYFVTSQFLNEQYLLAGGNGTLGDEFRIGFNVNRIFATGRKKRMQ